MIPNHHKYNLIVWGAQECVQGGAKLYYKQLAEYLGSDFVQVAAIDMWEMFIVVFCHKKDA